MRETSWLEKLSASLVNVFIVALITLPVNQIFPRVDWRVVALSVFFVYSLSSLVVSGKRDLGMMVVGSSWKEEYPLSHFLLYTVLYTISFVTIFIWVFFPFDLLLLNLIVQFLMIRLTGTTLHGLIAGDMVTVKNKR